MEACSMMPAKDLEIVEEEVAKDTRVLLQYGQVLVRVPAMATVVRGVCLVARALPRDVTLITEEMPNFQYLKRPNSMSACFFQTKASICDLMLLSNENMSSISLTLSSFSRYYRAKEQVLRNAYQGNMEDADETLQFVKTELQLRTKNCCKWANEVKDNAKTVSKVISELLEAVVAAQGRESGKLEETKLRLQELQTKRAQREMEAKELEEELAERIRIAEKAAKTYLEKLASCNGDGTMFLVVCDDAMSSLIDGIGGAVDTAKGFSSPAASLIEAATKALVQGTKKAWNSSNMKVLRPMRETAMGILAKCVEEMTDFLVPKELSANDREQIIRSLTDSINMVDAVNDEISVVFAQQVKRAIESLEDIEEQQRSPNGKKAKDHRVIGVELRTALEIYRKTIDVTESEKEMDIPKGHSKQRRPACVQARILAHCIEQMTDYLDLLIHKKLSTDDREEIIRSLTESIDIIGSADDKLSVAFRHQVRKAIESLKDIGKQQGNPDGRRVKDHRVIRIELQTALEVFRKAIEMTESKEKKKHLDRVEEVELGTVKERTKQGRLVNTQVGILADCVEETTDFLVPEELSANDREEIIRSLTDSVNMVGAVDDEISVAFTQQVRKAIESLEDIGKQQRSPNGRKAKDHRVIGEELRAAVEVYRKAIDVSDKPSVSKKEKKHFERVEEVKLDPAKGQTKQGQLKNSQVRTLADCIEQTTDYLDHLVPEELSTNVHEEIIRSLTEAIDIIDTVDNEISVTFAQQVRKAIESLKDIGKQQGSSDGKKPVDIGAELRKAFEIYRKAIGISESKKEKKHFERVEEVKLDPAKGQAKQGRLANAKVQIVAGRVEEMTDFLVPEELSSNDREEIIRSLADSVNMVGAVDDEISIVFTQQVRKAIESLKDIGKQQGNPDGEKPMDHRVIGEELRAAVEVYRMAIGIIESKKEKKHLERVEKVKLEIAKEETRQRELANARVSLESALEEKKQATALLDETYRKMRDTTREISDVVSQLSTLDFKKVDYEKVVEFLQNAIELIERLEADFRRMADFFEAIAAVIRLKFSANITSFLQSIFQQESTEDEDEEDGESDGEGSGAHFTKVKSANLIKRNIATKSMLKSISLAIQIEKVANVYLEISNQYVMPVISGEQKTFALSQVEAQHELEVIKEDLDRTNFAVKSLVEQRIGLKGHRPLLNYAGFRSSSEIDDGT